eukprot:CAMPEP_0197928766 /NCGR_PEP_ID=MMETSP1439-20131203/102874_1 /TAXON_ID=66791 /ORGANISM="Gonyaulax spinifera, Strain CCMP409" /LENGTH=82 /DNA_ID=CAMNT_0043551389 /DNA_START=289 /DNA_END=534 /DNA_ORIENTATION=+
MARRASALHGAAAGPTADGPPTRMPHEAQPGAAAGFWRHACERPRAAGSRLRSGARARMEARSDIAGRRGELSQRSQVGSLE